MNMDEVNERKRSKVRMGTFRIGEESFLSRRYVYIPSACLKSPLFNMEEIFEALEVDTPNILFRVFQTPRVKEWNLRLPPSRQYLVREKIENNNESDDDEGVSSGPLRHYHGVLRENCKRLLLGTGLACKKAGAGFRITESWNPEARDDAVAGWITDDNKANVLALGCACYKDFHPSIWKQLEDGMSYVEESDDTPVMNGAKDVIIDPEPFLNDEIEVTRDPKTKRIKNSFPHPGMSHLLLSDNLELLEKKLTEHIPWGLIMVNGSVAAADYYVEAIQKGLPTILFQHTGYTTDMAVQAYKKAKKLMAAKKHNPHALAERAFPDDMKVGHHLQKWLKPFDQDHMDACKKLNILLENWPSQFNEDSVFIVDMFSTTEDELQDRLTQTMGVVFGPQHEVGGHMSESKRLTFAWRTRAKYLLNARSFKLKSDILNALLVVFTLLSTVSAVVYTFLFYNEHIDLDGARVYMLPILLKANLLLPLVATLLRGMLSVFNPTMKYIALKNAAVKVEMEIYQYRTKVGKYSFRKPPAPSKDKKKKKKKEVKVVVPVLPRVAFSKEMEKILDELMASDVQHGSLQEFGKDFDPLLDINKRITSHRGVQESYSQPMISAEESKKKSMFNGTGTRAMLQKLHSIHHHDEEQRDFDDVEAGDILMMERRISNIPEATQKGEYEPFHRNGRSIVEEDASNSGNEVELDDGLKLMSADEYLSLRMLPMVAELSKKTPRLSTWSSTFTVCVLVLSVSAAALSTFDRSDFVPAALALSGGITAWASYQQTDLRLVLTNNALSQLNQLLVWWDGLTMIEKRIPINKETLVKTCEMAIISQATVVGGAMKTDHAISGEDDDEGNNTKQ
mmetsp:Transcript_19826/g.33346  ORF Transcript_19826/g.33346 Transcript_19826/m.33346 type:complete len:850 (+) Transcript_19826:52-2601(+)